MTIGFSTPQQHYEIKMIIGFYIKMITDGLKPDATSND
jgi:hypothetical protein